MQIFYRITPVFPSIFNGFRAFSHCSVSTKYKGKELLPLSVIDAARNGDAQAVDSVLRYYEGYINKLCTRTLYDPDGQPRVRVDEYMKRRLEIKLIHSIVSMN